MLFCQKIFAILISSCAHHRSLLIPELRNSPYSFIPRITNIQVTRYDSQCIGWQIKLLCIHVLTDYYLWIKHVFCAIRIYVPYGISQWERQNRSRFNSKMIFSKHITTFSFWLNIHFPYMHSADVAVQHYIDPQFFKRKTPYSQISWILGATRYRFRVVQSFWNLTGALAAVLQMRLSNISHMTISADTLAASRLSEICCGPFNKIVYFLSRHG